LEIPGLGPETADAILLYAAGRPVFVADAYARRILTRHRLISAHAGYEEVRHWLEAHLPSDPELFNEFHALLVAVGKSNCRSLPRCEGCALRFDLRGRPPCSLLTLAGLTLKGTRGPGSRSGPRFIGRIRSAPRRCA